MLIPISVMEFVLELEDEFGTEISDEDAEQIETVGGAVDYISSHSCLRQIQELIIDDPALSFIRICLITIRFSKKSAFSLHHPEKM